MSFKLFFLATVILSLNLACAHRQKRQSTTADNEFSQLKKKIATLEDENSTLKFRLQSVHSNKQVEPKANKSNSLAELSMLRNSIQHLYDLKKYGEVITATASLQIHAHSAASTQIDFLSIRFIRAMAFQRIGLETQAEEIFKDLALSKHSKISRLAREQLNNSDFLKRKISKTSREQ